MFILVGFAAAKIEDVVESDGMAKVTNKVGDFVNRVKTVFG